MDILKQQDLKELVETLGEWCISLYLPTHRVGREQQQDPIRFRNLMVRAQDKVLEYGLRRPEVQALIQPAESLLMDEDFWQHQSDGLAIFLSPGFSQVYRLPSRFDELVGIAKTFHINPLLPLLSKDGEFYILAVSLNAIRLFLDSRDNFSQVELRGLPTSLQEALWLDDPEKHIDFHTSTAGPSGLGNRPAIFHGHGNQSDEDRKNILRYFQKVNDGLKVLLTDTNYPMVLAGVDYLLPIYHQANTYPGLLDEGLPGNPDRLDGKDLHNSAWELVEPIFKETQRQSIAQVEQLVGQKNDLASTDLKAVVKAAKFGRVEALFVPLGVQSWGHYDTEQDRVVLEPGPSPENEDLLNLAAMHTLLNSGRVYAVRPPKMPGGGDLAAILRYAA